MLHDQPGNVEAKADTSRVDLCSVLEEAVWLEQLALILLSDAAPVVADAHLQHVLIRVVSLQFCMRQHLLLQALCSFAEDELRRDDDLTIVGSELDGV